MRRSGPYGKRSSFIYEAGGLFRELQACYLLHKINIDRFLIQTSRSVLRYQYTEYIMRPSLGKLSS